MYVIAQFAENDADYETYDWIAYNSAEENE